MYFVVLHVVYTLLLLLCVFLSLLSIVRHFHVYAHMLIVVDFLVVNFFAFLIIARNPPKRFWRKLVEILPTSLPELLKPSRDLLELRKSKFLNPIVLYTILKVSFFIFLLIFYFPFSRTPDGPDGAL